MDLSTTYLGLKLKSPLVPSASPLSDNLDTIKRMEDAGAAAIVMFSLFEEQVKQEGEALEHFLSYGTESFSEALSYFPAKDEFRVTPDRYLKLIADATKATDIPIIGSLNGISSDGWVETARRIQEAGAKAIELNIYYIPTDMNKTGAEIERQYLDVVLAVKDAVTVPVAVKLGPFFSSMANMAKRVEDAGADGLVLFNRFYQPDFDLQTLDVVSSLSLSTPAEMRLPLLWISVLYGKLKCSLAATTGVHSAQDAIKYIMAGADITMTTSALLQYGIEHLTVMQQDMKNWMEQNEYESVRQMRGSMSQQAVANPTVFERANYIRVLGAYKNPYTTV